MVNWRYILFQERERDREREREREMVTFSSPITCLFNPLRTIEVGGTTFVICRNKNMFTLLAAVQLDMPDKLEPGGTCESSI